MQKPQFQLPFERGHGLVEGRDTVGHAAFDCLRCRDHPALAEVGLHVLHRDAAAFRDVGDEQLVDLVDLLLAVFARLVGERLERVALDLVLAGVDQRLRDSLGRQQTLAMPSCGL